VTQGVTEDGIKKTLVNQLFAVVCCYGSNEQRMGLREQVMHHVLDEGIVRSRKAASNLDDVELCDIQDRCFQHAKHIMRNMRVGLRDARLLRELEDLGYYAVNRSFIGKNHDSSVSKKAANVVSKFIKAWVIDTLSTDTYDEEKHVTDMLTIMYRLLQADDSTALRKLTIIDFEVTYKALKRGYAPNIEGMTSS
jgi:hypothetical protein